MAHWKVAIGLPWACIIQMAKLGKHCLAQPASPFARQSPNLTKHLASQLDQLPMPRMHVLH